MGAFEAQLGALHKRTGQDIESLREKPEVDPDLVFIWNAFSELHRCRQVWFAPSPLAIGDIVLWFDLQGIRDEEARRDLFWLVKEMDGAWLESQRKENK